MDSTTFNNQTAAGAYDIYVVMQDGANHFTPAAIKLSPEEVNAFKGVVSNLGGILSPEKVIDAAKTMSDIDPNLLNPKGTYFSGDVVKEAISHEYNDAFSTAIDAYNDIAKAYGSSPLEFKVAGDVFTDHDAVARQRADIDMMISPMVNMATLNTPAGAGEDFAYKASILENAQMRLERYAGFAHEIHLLQNEYNTPEGTPQLDWSQLEYDSQDTTPSLDAAGIKIR